MEFGRFIFVFIFFMTICCQNIVCFKIASAAQKINLLEFKVRTIFLEKSNCKEEIHKAILLESQKKWRHAQEKYEELLKIDLSADRQDFYYESSFKCLAHLGKELW